MLFSFEIKKNIILWNLTYQEYPLNIKKGYIIDFDMLRSPLNIKKGHN